MKILFNDIIQNSNAPLELKSPALSEIIYFNNQQLIINLHNKRNVNSLGIGYTNGKNFTFIFDDVDDTVSNFEFTENGLYVMNKNVFVSKIIIETDATFIGRIGAGVAVNILTAVAKEPAYCSTNEPRKTLSGQVVKGLGGYNYRTLSLDSRYKIDEFAMSEIKEGYKYISQGYPFFIDLTVESYKLPFSKLYANERNQQMTSFESGILKYLYSRRWEFEERF